MKTQTLLPKWWVITVLSGIAAIVTLACMTPDYLEPHSEKSPPNSIAAIERLRAVVRANSLLRQIAAGNTDAIKHDLSCQLVIDIKRLMETLPEQDEALKSVAGGICARITEERLEHPNYYATSPARHNTETEAWQEINGQFRSAPLAHAQADAQATRNN